MPGDLMNIINSRQKESERLSIFLSNHNNSSDPNYNRQIPEVTTQVVNNQVVGPRLNVSSYQDKFTEYTIREYGGEASRTSTIKDAMERLTSKFGKPGDSDQSQNQSPVKAIDNFFNTVRTLASPGGQENVTTQVVREGENLCLTFNELSKGMALIKKEADSKIADSVGDINSLIRNIQSLNTSISQSPAGSSAKAVQEGQQINLINELSGYLDISVIDNDDGSRIVQTGNGETLAGNAVGQLSYDKSSSFESFRKEDEFDAIKLKQYRTIEDSEPFFTTELASKAPKDGKAETTITTGELKGLLELRDELIDDKIAVLDNLSQVITDTVNSIHNQGSGKPPNDKFVGSSLTSLSEHTRWSGSFRIAALDENGGAIQRNNDNSYISPLDLDLEALKDEHGSEGVDVETILNEINEYFSNSPVNKRAELNNLRDIKMVAADKIETGPTKFKFNLELQNQSNFDSQVRVTDVTVRDNGGNVVAGAASNYNQSFTSKAGTKDRTEQDITLDLGAGASGPYTVEVSTEVLADNGSVETGVIDYDINVDVSDKEITNTRYYASNVSGDASLKAPDSSHGYLRASLVDENGAEITDKNKKGYIKISGQKGYHLALEDMNSEELGRPNLGAGKAIAATNKGLGHYFGLNNFFATDDNGKTDSQHISVKREISSQPSLISVGKLTQLDPKTDTFEVGVKKASAAISFNNTNPQDGDTISVGGKTFTFKNTAGGNDQIEIGANMDATLDNAVSTLSAENSYTLGEVRKAGYQRSGNGIEITYKTAGEIGNSFNVGFNLSGGALASINGSAQQSALSSGLTGGEDSTVTRDLDQYGFEIAESDNSIANDLSRLSTDLVDFKAAGSLLNSETTLHAYASNFMNEAMRSFNFYNVQYKGYKQTFDSFNNSYNENAKPDPNEELAKIIQQTQSLQRMDKLFKLVRQSNEMIFEVL
jgi:flagellar hook-associated protein FlgK